MWSKKSIKKGESQGTSSSMVLSVLNDLPFLKHPLHTDYAKRAVKIAGSVSKKGSGTPADTKEGIKTGLLLADFGGGGYQITLNQLPTSVYH